MKILVAYRRIHNTAGGVERMSSLLMNEMARRGHIVQFLTLDDQDAVSFYPLDQTVVWHKLGIGDPSKRADFDTRVERILATRFILKKFRPDVILAFQEASFLSARIAAAGLGIPVIAAERNSPSRFSFMALAKRHLAFQSFRFAKCVTIQCESFRNYYPRRLHGKIQTIPNPVFPAEPSDTPRKNVILSVGRLEYQKNFQVLVAAFAKIADRFPDWSLVILGEGEDREELEEKIAQSGLGHRIALPGTSGDLQSHYETAKIFCLPSRWEGFPNALAEALASGVPCVGFADCDGVSELIASGKNGLLASGGGDPDALAAALEKLMADDTLREGLSRAAVESVVKYKPSAIFGRWERLLREAAGK